MSAHARAILWAQWRIWLNYYPRSNRLGTVLGALLAAVWYGMWLLFAFVIFKIFSEEDALAMSPNILPAGLMFVFIYWQIVPVLLASTGVSLELKKLQVYPVPNRQLFRIELLLRITASFEMFLILLGLGAGLLANPKVPFWGPPLALIPFVVFNLATSAGTREILIRIMSRKRVREIAVLLLVSIGAIPHLLMVTGALDNVAEWLKGPSLSVWPWSAAASLASGRFSGVHVAALLAWTGLAWIFGRLQFEKGLRFDAAESNATPPAAASKTGLWGRAVRWPALIFRDPLAALIEKEIRFLARAPRFRLVFTMGFTFGLVIWLPMSFGRDGGQGFLAENYLTMVSLYAMLLLGDVCFWNIFGFDRSAAQAYWVMPVRFSTVLMGKNVAALFFVFLDITIIVAVCALLRRPMTPLSVAEAYAVSIVVALYMTALGNVTSTAMPRAVNPSKAMRSGSAGRLQAMLLLLYPVAAVPALLAYGARYAFRSEAAFFAVLGVSALAGCAMYWVGLDSALENAVNKKEQILTALSQGEGLIQG